jgi:hypothetical protein
VYGLFDGQHLHLQTLSASYVADCQLSGELEIYRRVCGMPRGRHGWRIPFRRRYVVDGRLTGKLQISSDMCRCVRHVEGRTRRIPSRRHCRGASVALPGGKEHAVEACAGSPSGRLTQSILVPVKCQHQVIFNLLQYILMYSDPACILILHALHDCTFIQFLSFIIYLCYQRMLMH